MVDVLLLCQFTGVHTIWGQCDDDDDDDDASGRVQDVYSLAKRVMFHFRVNSSLFAGSCWVCITIPGCRKDLEIICDDWGVNYQREKSAHCPKKRQGLLKKNRGHYITNPNNALLWGNPPNLPYICTVWSPTK